MSWAMGGVPPEAAIRMKELHKEYKKTARVLTGMGYNGGMMNVKLPKVTKATVFENNKGKIQHLMENHCMNKAGGLFKTGLIMANCDVVNQCNNRRVAEMEKKKMEAAATKTVDKSVDTLNKAKAVYEEWVRRGRKVDANGCLELDRPSSYAVVKFLLPKIDIKGELHLKDFRTMKKCNEWFGGIRRG